MDKGNGFIASSTSPTGLGMVVGKVRDVEVEKADNGYIIRYYDPAVGQRVVKVAMSEAEMYAELELAFR